LTSSPDDGIVVFTFCERTGGGALQNPPPAICERAFFRLTRPVEVRHGARKGSGE
jgi:hypothetical protein